MVWHLVLMTPAAELAPGARRALADSFARAVRDIPSVRHVHLGSRVRHGAAYEALMPDSADLLICLAFDDRAGLEAYLGHRAHVDLAARFNESLSSTLVYDFDVGGLERLDELRLRLQE